MAMMACCTAFTAGPVDPMRRPTYAGRLQPATGRRSRRPPAANERGVGGGVDPAGDGKAVGLLEGPHRLAGVMPKIPSAPPTTGMPAAISSCWIRLTA